MRRTSAVLILIALLAVSVPALAQAPDQPLFREAEGILYGNAGSGWVPAELTAHVVQQTVELPTGESYLIAQVHAEIDGGSYPVSAQIGVPVIGGDYALPTVAGRAVDDDGTLTIEVEAADGLTLTFTGGTLTAFERTDDDEPEMTIAGPDPRAFEDASGLFATIDGVLVRLPVEGFAYGLLYPLDDERRIAVTSAMDVRDGIFTPVERMYLVDMTTLAVTLLVEGNIVLQGDVAALPDGDAVLYTAYSDETGAAVWRAGLDGQGEPEMIVNRLPFYADAGNFALPTFVDVTDDTFSIVVVIIDFESGDAPVDRSEIRTYTLDGDLIDSAPKPTATPEE